MCASVLSEYNTKGLIRITLLLVLMIFIRELIWHVGQSSIRPSIYFSLFEKSRLNPFLEPTSTMQWGQSSVVIWLVCLLSSEKQLNNNLFLTLPQQVHRKYWLSRKLFPLYLCHNTKIIPSTLVSRPGNKRSPLTQRSIKDIYVQGLWIVLVAFLC